MRQRSFIGCILKYPKNSRLSYSKLSTTSFLLASNIL